MKTAVKMILGSFAVCLAFGVLADDATISRVTVQQRWPWSRLADIDYVLTADPTQRVDVAVTAYNGSVPLTLPAASLSGDLNGVTEGAHRIVLDPTKTAYTNSEVLTKFRVALVPSVAPLYLVIDLSGGTSATAYPVSNYLTAADVPGGVTSDLYKTTSLLLRRIPANAFKMGDSVPPTISTALAKEFYAGVFEVTQRQWELITGAKPSFFNNSTYYASRPVEQVSYNDVRGATNGSPAVDWPGTGVSVLPSSFVGLLRAKTGLSDFDLPTEAQWECLCRAGTTTYYNDNGATPENTTSNAQMDVLGRYQYNGGKVWNGSAWNDPARGCEATNGTAVVGSYQANEWGLYDTHGNVWEWCLDWYAGSLAGGADPSGAVSGSYRVLRGGSWSGAASICRSASRGYCPPSDRGSVIGFRLVRTLP
jgi:formylglycine-generating enzyme required for sulfatase activity